VQRNVEERIRSKMKARGIADAVMDDFVEKVRRASHQPAFVPLSEVETPGPDLLVTLSKDSAWLDRLEDRGMQLLEQLVVIKLNGGRSTTMGGSVPKGILLAKDGLSYLEIVIAQMEALGKEYGLRIPLILMNSFFTHDLSMEIVNRLRVPVMTLLQSQVPRLLQDTFAPLETDTEEDWVPPGHGDLYDSMRHSGLLDRLLSQGYRWAFISNLDNLAACLDPWILGLMDEERIDFLLEVTDRTNADRKGGTPILRDRRLQLLEIAQVKPEERAVFQDIHRFPFFNTNNIWVDLRALSSALSHGAMNLPIIQNRKTVAGQDVVQLETAMGAALGCFGRAKALKVGRGRFFPTKKVSDLFVLQSDACVLDSLFRLRRNPLRPSSLPMMPRVFFSEDFLNSPLAMNDRFDDPGSISLLRADVLDVYGSVHFGANVTIRGRVEIRAGNDDTYHIPRGRILSGGRYPPLARWHGQDAHAAGPDLYPLELSRLAVEKVWGSAAIGWAFSKDMANLPIIGELWETFDGQDEGSVVLNGSHRLKPLRELVSELKAALVGDELTDFVDRSFPLLIKYLFPSQALSVQVHPDDAYATEHENSRGKTEMWLVLNAAHGSFAILGWEEGLSKQDILRKLREGDLHSALRTVHPRPGDVYFIPPGTVHALGPGVSVLEIQQNSDVTYRLYDWNRADDTTIARPLHIEKALDVLDFTHVPEYRITSLRVPCEKGECVYLCACTHFAACRWDLRGKTAFVSDPSRFWVLNVVAGQGSIQWPGGDPLWVEQGSTLLIPAGLGAFSMEPSGPVSLVKSWVPDLWRDIVVPLRASGFSDVQIAGLGGMGRGNDLRGVLSL